MRGPAGVLSGITLALLVGGGAMGGQAETTDQGTPEEELSLSKGSVFEVDAPDAVRENTSDPGERPVLVRAHAEMPPPTPHAIRDFLPITREDNLCVECHQVEEKVAGEPTPIPASHYVDSRHAPGVVGSSLVGARYYCVSCHVAQTEAAPLVANTLGAAAE